MPLETRVPLEILVPKGQQAFKVKLELSVIQEPSVIPVLLEIQEHLATRGHKAYRVRLESKVRREPSVTQAPLETQVPLEIQDLKAPRVCRVRRALLEIRAH